jgi:hypothetical protein
MPPEDDAALTALQREFLALLYQPPGPPVPAALHAAIRGRAALEPPSLLQLYRRGTQATLIAALQSTHPATAAALGRGFAALARRYLLERPSRSGNLGEFGCEFGQWLELQRELVGGIWMAELARYEALLETTSSALPAVALTRSDLASLAADERLQLRAPLHPRVRRFAARHAVTALRRAWENGEPASEPAAAPERWLLSQAGSGALLVPLYDGEWEWFGALDEGATLLEATERAQTASADFDAATALAKALDLRLLCAAPAAGPMRPDIAFCRAADSARRAAGMLGEHGEAAPDRLDEPGWGRFL